jgi:CRP-like cAMP-binding protein
MFLFDTINMGDDMKMENVSFFENVDQRILNEVKTTSKKYNKNQTVYYQGDDCNSMDIVLSGSLVAYSLSQNGSESVVFEFKKGKTIGANLLFSNASNYPMNIYCTESCELLHIKKAEIENLLHDYNFAMNFIRNISFNSQGMNKKITMYSQKSLRENLRDYFMALSAEQKSNNIVLPISKKQLTDYFGVQRPSLFRELKKMKDEGLIEVKNKEIILCNHFF